MERSTSVPTSASEQNITPGEQRILALLEQKLTAHGQQLEDLMIKVDQEIGASKMRDRQLAIDLQRLREESQRREVKFIADLSTRIDQSKQWVIESLDLQVNTLRKDLGERFHELDTRLGVLEQVAQLTSKQLYNNTQSIQGLQQEVRKLSEALTSHRPGP
jgi:DNA anti-recombination protein RmuC